MGKVFSITEMRPDGAGGYVPREGGDRFMWWSEPRPVNSDGGGRAAPLGPLVRGGQMRTVRTDYPGVRQPSEQILGPAHKQHTYRGRWDDRYNHPTIGGPPSYAMTERRRFEDMCRRGSVVEIRFEDLAYLGVVVEWDFEDYRAQDVGYSFTVSVHERTGEDTSQSRSPDTVMTVVEAYSKTEVIHFSVQAKMDEAPVGAVPGNTLSNVSRQLDQATAAMNDMADMVDNRDRVPGLKTVGQFKRLATQLRVVTGAAFNVVDSLVGVRSDIDLTYRTAMTVLDFETWTRAMRYRARLLMGQAAEGGRAMDERDQPNAIAIYEPYKGESLYSISRRYYGTPHAWRLIAERNNLDTFELDGTERLIIPERGRG